MKNKNKLTESIFFVYHGTDATFDEFSYDYLGKGNDEYGPGFYFSSSKEGASYYGNVKKYRIRLNKIVSDYSKPKLEDIKMIIAKSENMNNIEDLELLYESDEDRFWDSGLSNYGQTPYEAIYNCIKIFSQLPTEYAMFMSAWSDIYSYDNKKFLQKMVEMGYDGYMANRNGVGIFVVYNPRNIKREFDESKTSNIDRILKNTSKLNILKEGKYYTDVDEYLAQYDLYWILNNATMQKSIWEPLINPNLYKKALKEYVTTGELIKFPSKYIEDMVDIIMKNGAIFENCQQLWGATEYVPYEQVYDYFYEDYNCEEFKEQLYANGKIESDSEYHAMMYLLEEHGILDKIRLPDGSPSMSDTQGYLGLMDEFNDCETDEEYLVLINRILDIFHQRGDLASLFIKGGRDVLTQISNESVQYKNKVILESSQTDTNYRETARDILNHIQKQLYKNDDNIILNENEAFVDITSIVKSIIPTENRNIYLRFVYAGYETSYSFGLSRDKTMVFFTFPIFEKPCMDLATSLAQKNRKKYNEISTKEERSIFIRKLIKKYIQKHLRNKLEYDDSTIIHEIVHYLDNLRFTQTYKSKSQKLDTEKDYIDYYNSPIEQNAFYQETTHLFDNWIKDDKYRDEDVTKKWSNFKDFYLDFIYQYRGRYDILNDVNKRKLKKRAYQYWNNYFDKE